MSTNTRQHRRMSAAQFKEAIAAHGPRAGAGAVVIKGYPGVAKAESGRVLSLTLSTARVDRDGDTIDVNGWDLDHYKRNPVVLWAHSYQQLPIAKALDIGVVGGALKARAEFAPGDLNPLSESVLAMYKQGYLNAVSVGFDPILFKGATDRPGGLNFSKVSLLEFSAVPVPSNPDALIEARSKGIAMAPIVQWAEQTLADLGAPSNMRRSALSVARTLQPSKTYIEIKDDDEIDIESIPPMTTQDQAESLADRLAPKAEPTYEEATRGQGFHSWEPNQ